MEVSVAMEGIEPSLGFKPLPGSNLGIAILVEPVGIEPTTPPHIGGRSLPIEDNGPICTEVAGN